MTTNNLKEKILTHLTDNAGVSYSAEKLAHQLGMDDAERLHRSFNLLLNWKREKGSSN